MRSGSIVIAKANIYHKKEILVRKGWEYDVNFSKTLCCGKFLDLGFHNVITLCKCGRPIMYKGAPLFHADLFKKVGHDKLFALINRIERTEMKAHGPEPIR